MKILRAIYTLCVAALLCSSCQDEEMIKQSSVKEGIPVTIDLTFSAVVPKQETVGTRAITDPEYRVNDLYVLIFNANTGKLKGEVLSYDYSKLQDDQKEIVQDGKTTLQGTLSQIKTTTGESIIYAIANVNNPPSEYSSQSEGQPLATRIQKVQSISDLEAITAELSAPNSSNALFRITDTHYIMSGFKVYNIMASENNDIDIPLYRTDSKITFNIKAGTGNESKCTSFTLLSYQVCKVAAKTSLVPLAEERNYDTGTENATNYWNTEAGIQPEETNTITFYVPENIKSAKANTGATDTYAEREKWQSEGNEGASTDDRSFVTAPDNGTYVVLHGLFEGKAFTNNYHPENGTFEDENVEARATVDYIIHLGDWTEDKLGTFSNKRNVEYTYNITVNGVDDVVVEVESDDKKENEPGAEGDVFFQNGVFYNVDCHNVALLMEFTKQEIDNVGGSDDYFQAVINSPFGSKDKDWLRFVLNDRDGSGNYVRSLHSYPGDPGRITNAESTYLTLDELMTALKDIRDAHLERKKSNYEDNKGDLVVTCFVKEYTYDDYESYLGTNAFVPANSDNWGDYTNKSDREAYIFGAINYSPDRNSSTIHTKYVISQRSIQTMDEYVGYEGIGLGIETYNETGQIPMGNPNNKPTDPATGLENMKSMLSSGNAPKYNVKDQTMWGYTKESPNGIYNAYQSFPDDYKYAAYACLLRNRDEDGNGSIEGDEIKWYLPALDQYTAFYVGLDALSNDSRFFMPENYEKYSNSIRRHYFAGTWGISDEGGDSAPYIIWSEEGIGTQVFKGGDYGKESTLGDARDYRCIRNLGTGIRKAFFYYDKSTRVITINHQVADIYRSRINNLDDHNERDRANRLYTKFQVAEHYLDRNNNGKYLDQPNNDNKGDTWLDSELENNDPCRSFREGGYTNWRLPNQRELLVMMTTGDIFLDEDFENSKGAILTCHKIIGKTTYSYYNSGTTKYRYFIQATGGGDSGDQGVTGFIMQLQDAKSDEADRRGFVRCVRDVEVPTE